MTPKPRTIIALALRDVMCERFPKCFSASSPKPLKIGITHDLRAICPDIAKHYLRIFMRFYTFSFDYCIASSEDADRIDLDGNVCGKVTASEAAYAAKQLRKARKKHYERKKKEKLKAQAELSA